MARSLSTLLNQIERLQKEAASIQSEVVGKMRKEIAKYGLTAEQLFGQPSARQATTRSATKKTAPKQKVVKFADGSGNTWGGMGKRPDWLRQALAAGKAIEDFLIAAGGAKAPAGKRVARSKAAPDANAKVPAKKRAAAKKSSGRKPRATPSGEASAG